MALCYTDSTPPFGELLSVAFPASAGENNKNKKVFQKVIDFFGTGIYTD